MHDLAVYVKEGLLFARDLNLSKTLQVLTYVFYWLYVTQCLTSFFSINHLLYLYAWLLILFHLTQMRLSRLTNLPMCLSLETLMPIIRTDQPILVELIDLVNSNNFSISNDLTQMVNFPTQICDCDSHIPALLNLFISSDTSICSTMAFPSLENSDHVVVSVSIDFPTNSK